MDYYTPWEVLCKFASRYRIPRRRPDGRLKTEAQLEDDIYEHEQRRPTLREGSFFSSRRITASYESGRKLYENIQRRVPLLRDVAHPLHDSLPRIH